MCPAFLFFFLSEYGVFALAKLKKTSRVLHSLMRFLPSNDDANWSTHAQLILVSFARDGADAATQRNIVASCSSRWTIFYGAVGRSRMARCRPIRVARRTIRRSSRYCTIRDRFLHSTTLHARDHTLRSPRRVFELR